jgi:hypothetical protein
MGFARMSLVLQGFATLAISVMALFLALASVASGVQYLALSGLALVVVALSALIATGMFIASAKLGSPSVRVRHFTVLAELLLFVPGVALAAFGTYATQHAGTPATPGTDGPFADGGEGLIALTGIAYAGGAVVVIAVLLLAPSVRRSFRT